jgi:DNA polymerase
MTTEEYIRDSRFETIGVGVKENDSEAVWFSGTREETKTFLNTYDWHNAIAVAHNALFDAAILTWIFSISPKLWVDTLALARAIDGVEVGGSLKACAERHGLGVKGTEVVNALALRRQDFGSEQLARYGEYCKNDCDLTYALALLYLKDLWLKPSEIYAIDITTRMFSEPVLELDLALLEQHLEEVKDHKAELLAACNADSETLNSNPKFADLLRSLGVSPPMKISPTTGKETYAFAKTDEGLKNLLEVEDLRVQAVVAARLGAKSTLEETRTERMISIAKRGTLPVPLRFYAAHTGRWGGTDKLNLQNLPKKSVIKQAMVAPDGYVIIDADSSQIEARVLAWLAGQTDLVQAFANGSDVYRSMAASIYRKAESDITPEERFMGKVVILGCGYGMGAGKFQAFLASGNPPRHVEQEECHQMIKTYRQRFHEIVNLWQQGNDCLKELLTYKRKARFGVQDQAVYMFQHGFMLPNSFSIRYPELQNHMVDNRLEFAYKTRTGRTRIYGGKVVENVVQALARCVIAEQMVSIAERYRPILTVHDAIAIVVPEAEAAAAIKYVNVCMKKAPAWADGLPLNCEIGVGKSYRDCEKKVKY